METNGASVLVLVKTFVESMHYRGLPAIEESLMGQVDRNRKKNLKTIREFVEESWEKLQPWYAYKVQPWLASWRAEDARPTAAHRLCAWLHRRGWLRRVYTQNVDGLHLAPELGLPASAVVECPGSFRDGMLSWRLQRLAAPP